MTPEGISLSDEQRRAVEWRGGPLMVLAGAGTGKTTVVVERVRHLLASDPSLQPENVLVLTYNVRAAAELTDRFERALGLEKASRLWVNNFHAFGNRLLTQHRAEVGLRDSGDVLDGVGQRLLLRDLRLRFGDFLYHRVTGSSMWSLDRFADVISRAKDELVTPEEFAAFARAKREAFDLTFGIDAFDASMAELRSRDVEGRMRGIRDTRRDLQNGRDAAERAAWREARREASGGGYATAWAQLTDEQQRLAKGLKDSFLRDAEAYEVLRLTEEAEAYAVYQEELRRRGVLDYGEQMLLTIQLLMERPNLLLRYQSQFRHVLVDEAQDLNMAQILLLELVGRGPDKPDDVVMVGDDDQSIYRFRGASYAAFDEFERRFSKAPAWDPGRPVAPPQRLPLLANRRSSANILAVASRLIEHNPHRLKADALEPTRQAGDPVDVVIARDEADEADAIVERIRAGFAALPERLPAPDGRDRPKRWSDVAVLYRKHRHREAIVERLRRAGIPYVVVGGTGLFAVPEVRDVEAALRVIADPSDSVSFVRLLSAGPWRLDAVEILRLTRAAAWDARPVFEAASEVLRRRAMPVEIVHASDPDSAGPDADGPLTLWDEADVPAGERTAAEARPVRSRQARSERRQEQLDVGLRTKLERLFGVLEALIPRANREGPFGLLEDYLVRTELLHDLIAVETPDSQRAVLAVARLMRFVSDWAASHSKESLADFVAYLDVYQQVGGDLDTDLPARVDVEGVQLMTVYQAKGLEYEMVVVPRLVEGQFPDLRDEARLIPVELLKQTPPPDFAMAEERRLAFVAMTRARSRLLLTAIDAPNGKPVSRFLDEGAPLDADGREPAGVVLERRALAPDAEVESGGRSADQAAAEATPELLKLMPVPTAMARRFGLRRRAVELIGALEALTVDDASGRRRLLDELVGVAEEAAGIAEETRRNGVDPITLTVLSRHAPAGHTLLELAPLEGHLSHSQVSSYLECPLAYAFERVYRIPVAETPGYFEFGHAIHAAFERYARARRDAKAAGAQPPDFEALQRALADVWQPTAYADAQAAEHYLSRSEPALRRFYDREVETLAKAVDFEVPFVFQMATADDSAPVRFTGVIDRIDRHPDGSIEITDYKTGRPKTQGQVDSDEQLTAYALALALGAVRDPVTGERLPAATRLTLYFTETDQAISTSRSPEQLDAFTAKLLDVARRIRSGDFAANPEAWRCGRCEYRRICPSRYGETPVA